MAQPAAAAAAAAAALPDPLDKVRGILAICGFGNNGNRFIQCHSIIYMSTFKLIPYNKAEDIVKIHNGRWKRAEQKIGYPVEKAL